MRWALGILILILAIGLAVYLLTPTNPPAPEAAPTQPSMATSRPVDHPPVDPLNPPPITLHVKDASLQEVIDQLSESMAIPLKAFTPGDQRFTVDLQNAPYWEAIKALAKFGDIAPYQAKDGTFGLIANHGSEGLDTGKVIGPFIIWGYRHHPDATADNFVYTIAAEPRTPLVATNVKVTVLDKTGKPLAVPGTPMPASFADRMAPVTELNAFSEVISLKSFQEKNPAAEFGSVKLNARVNVALRPAKATIEIAEAGKDLSQVLDAGKAQITVNQMSNAGGLYTLMFACKIDDQKTPAHVKITNAAGEVRFNGYITDQGGVPLGKNFTMPCRVEFEVPEEIKTVELEHAFDLATMKLTP